MASFRFPSVVFLIYDLSIDQQASVFLALKLVDINDKCYWSMHILHLIARLVMKVGILIPAKFSHHELILS